jgi:hypothetical protein
MNTLNQYFVPQWISILFLIAIPLPFILISLFVKNEALKVNYPKAFQIVTGFFLIYIAYVIFASYQGWFNKVSLPPRVLLLTTFPYAILLFMVIAKTNFYNYILEKSPIESLVKLHIFRLIGVFFILLAVHNTLPKPFAFIAGLGDIITAITSIFVARAIQNKESYAKKLTTAWNIFGTIDILFTAIAANVITKFSIDNGTMGVDTLAMFPFCLIPAFAPPTILFLHWTIYQKLKKI